MIQSSFDANREMLSIFFSTIIITPIASFVKLSAIFVKVP
jgi:hypothetical protein